MLELKNITKTYHTAGEDVEALKGIDLKFRNSEFVCILGPSGCGKTTLLNIIGGLDSYTSGDLVINGRTTKEYRDRDWDAYRNHSVGFVFQNYNLIPHQTVLSNVELALTLTGVSKKERRQRAREALEKVGLGDHLSKKPAQLSGGQMQRVAIARAIVNNPDIILADEPTGALDTETSRQVMDILKEIAKDRLVVMVTHNPVLAAKYSTRIVKMLDGRIIDDSRPLTDEEYRNELEEVKQKKTDIYKKKMPSMSFGTSFGLSLRNLITKKGRTALTSFAGSIGIIGIALIYAVSRGTTAFIDSVQEDTLASYPITIEAQNVDMTTLISTFLGKAKSISGHEDDAVYQKAMIYEMMNAMNSVESQKNDLKAFREFIEAQRADENSKLYSALSGVQYSYDLDLLIYTKNVDGNIIRSDRQTLMTEVMRKYAGMDMSTMLALREQTVMGSTDNMMKRSMALWKELVPGDGGRPVNSVTEKQYDIIYGRWPSEYDELVLFVDENNEIDDLKEIKYTDYVGLIMSSVTTIINAVTYVLIAFVAVSLVVSSIMIGVVTLISVQERTREIGILRAMGASKRNISSLFNAETVIIGFASGMLGVLITYLLCIPINIILRHLTGLGNLAAYLPPEAAVALVVISMLLTLIAGIIPSRSAAKKDPVVALRAE